MIKEFLRNFFIVKKIEDLQAYLKKEAPERFHFIFGFL